MILGKDCELRLKFKYSASNSFFQFETLVWHLWDSLSNLRLRRATRTNQVKKAFISEYNDSLQ